MANPADEPVLLAIAEGVAAHVGEAFLFALVRSLQSAMDVTVAFLTEAVGAPPERAHARFVVRENQTAQGFEYDLAGTPCQRVYEGRTVVIPCDVARLFPVEQGYEGYAGVPLWSADGEVKGHLAVLSETPIESPDQVERILRIYGVRAQAEIERMRLEREREQLIQSLRRTNQRLDRRAAAARAANATKSQLLALAAHDMRGALQTISLRSDAILAPLATDAPATDDHLRKAAQKSLEAVDRMSTLIAGMMDRARKETETLPLHRAEVDVADVLSRAKGFNQDHATGKQMAITVAVPDGLTLSADEDLLIEALDNLVSNAVKYAPPGSAIRVAASPGDARLRFTVEDEGPGLTDDDMARVFGRFQTLSAAPTGGEVATGLGLSLVKAIAEAHGGTAWVENRETSGARFGIDLPR